jgi:hypothetical protein
MKCIAKQLFPSFEMKNHRRDTNKNANFKFKVTIYSCIDPIDDKKIASIFAKEQNVA